MGYRTGRIEVPDIILSRGLNPGPRLAVYSLEKSLRIGASRVIIYGIGDPYISVMAVLPMEPDFGERGMQHLGVILAQNDDLRLELVHGDSSLYLRNMIGLFERTKEQPIRKRIRLKNLEAVFKGALRPENLARVLQH